MGRTSTASNRLLGYDLASHIHAAIAVALMDAPRRSLGREIDAAVADTILSRLIAYTETHTRFTPDDVAQVLVHACTELINPTDPLD